MNKILNSTSSTKFFIFQVPLYWPISQPLKFKQIKYFQIV